MYDIVLRRVQYAKMGFRTPLGFPCCPYGQKGTRMSSSIIRTSAFMFAAASLLTSCVRTDPAATSSAFPPAALQATSSVTTPFELAGERLTGPTDNNCVRGFQTHGRAAGPYPGTFQGLVTWYQGKVEVSFTVTSGQFTITGRGGGPAFGCTGRIPYSATFMNSGKAVGSTSGRAAVTSDFATLRFSLVFETG
jgi:hypothetical protein